MERLVCVGPFDAGAEEYLKQHAERPVDFVGEAPPRRASRTPSSSSATALEASSRASRSSRSGNLHIVRERDLCDRFGLVPA